MNQTIHSEIVRFYYIQLSLNGCCPFWFSDLHDNHKTDVYTIYFKSTNVICIKLNDILNVSSRILFHKNVITKLNDMVFVVNTTYL